MAEVPAPPVVHAVYVHKQVLEREEGTVEAPPWSSSPVRHQRVKRWQFLFRGAVAAVLAVPDAQRTPCPVGGRRRADGVRPLAGDVDRDGVVPAVQALQELLRPDRLDASVIAALPVDDSAPSNADAGVL